MTIAFEPIDPDAAFVDLSIVRRSASTASVRSRSRPMDRLVRVALPPLDPGPYTVSYQVVSAVDGHATIGRYAFLVDPTGAAAPPTTPPTASSPSVDALTVTARWIGLLGLLVAFGSLVGWWRGRPCPGRLPPIGVGPPWALFAGASAAAAIGVIGYPGCRLARSSTRSGRRPLDSPSTWPEPSVGARSQSRCASPCCRDRRCRRRDPVRRQP